MGSGITLSSLFGPKMPDLKSIRQTLQECTEDDATGRGSGSRLVVILSVLTLCVCLVGAISAHVQFHKDMEGIISSLVAALGLGGGGPYVLKQVFGKGLALPSPVEKPTKEEIP